MRFSRLSTVATFVAVGQAFLIPPTISSTDDDVKALPFDFDDDDVVKALPFDLEEVDDVKALPFEDAVDIEGRLMEISCPGCPVEITNLAGEVKAASSDIENILRLDFALVHSDEDQLILNGVQIYPIDPTSDTFMEPLTADQLVETDDGEWNYAASPKLGYSLSLRHPVAETDDSDDYEPLDIVSLHLEIVEVAGVFVDGIPAIDIQLLETPSGKLIIGGSEIVPAQSTISAPTDDEQECTTILCKWQAIIAEKMSKLKGCMGQAGPQVETETEPEVAAEPASEPQPHGPHRHHHTHDGFSRFVQGVVFHIFIPIIIGVCVGITASLVGMIVGHLAIFLWRIIFRRGERSTYHKVQQKESVSKDDQDDETKSFLEHQNPPPVYEEAPAYTDTVANEKA